VPRHASPGEVGEGRKARRDVPEAGANRWRIFVEITVEGARFSEKCHLFASRRRRRDCKANKAGKGSQEPPREGRALRRIFTRSLQRAILREQNATAAYCLKLVCDYFQVLSSIYRSFTAIRRAKGARKGSRNTTLIHVTRFIRVIYMSHRIASHRIVYCIAMM